MTTKSEWFALRLSQGEKKKLERAATSAHMTKSEYVRSLIAGSSVQIIQLNIDGKRLDELLYALKKSSSNLNQIAYRANKGDIPDLREVQETLAFHRFAAETLSRFIDETRP
ncbi:hypothetical protein [Eggerthella sp. YY7918]|uniref:plasmid mobilization protein n=1 Tax=Eggerthella sp. (strain YY7918) TaxID=502558 RepID=UPI0002171297|nr:hypothetical protein [Eggerthella sp. YY7918]BAK45827.1 hypothetical protein EGYY_28500 [Eggerthella sp. YY7918]